MSAEREVAAGRGPTVVLLHGHGAAHVVWEPVREVLAARGDEHRLVVPDLPGHGRSGRLPRYSPAAMAAAVAECLPADEPVVVVGHSLGGLIALVLGTGLFGVRVGAVLAASVKVDWTEDEIAARAGRAAQPARRFDERADALERFRRLAGLPPGTDPARLAAGVRVDGDAWVLANDPVTGGVAPLAPGLVADLAHRLTCPLRLARGADDAMVGPDEMATLGPVTIIDGAGHNVHVDAPEQFATMISQTVSDAAPSSPPAGGGVAGTEGR